MRSSPFSQILHFAYKLQLQGLARLGCAHNIVDEVIVQPLTASMWQLRTEGWPPPENFSGNPEENSTAIGVD